MTKPLCLRSVKIQGYRPFKDFLAPLGPMEVIVGANGSGKSSLFEFLRFLRDSLSLYQNIPPGIISDYAGQRIFHSPGPEEFSWDIEVEFPQLHVVGYKGKLMGPMGHRRVVYESVQTEASLLMERDENRYFTWDFDQGRSTGIVNQDQLVLGFSTDPKMEILYKLREYILGWRFYDSFNIDRHNIRRPVLVEQAPVLNENARNLSALLHYFVTEHHPAVDDLQQHLRLTIPGFRNLMVKAQGAPGEVIAFWQEEGVDSDLSLADLSDGILQLICWTALCVQPNPPSLICIDEPDQGVHPRTLPVLAGLFEKACDRTQIILATHSSYFLKQFDISRIAVMRKENGEAKFIKPKNSAVLIEFLKDFGPEEIEIMHRNGELEYFA